jgi:hypothetical protein
VESGVEEVRSAAAVSRSQSKVINHGSWGDSRSTEIISWGVRVCSAVNLGV